MKLETWEYNVLDMNLLDSPKLQFIVDFIRKYSATLEGDYVEVGVYKGKSFLTICNLINELSPKKKKVCWAYDTFDGFPVNTRKDERDSPSKFHDMYAKGIISSEHYSDIKRLIQIRSFQDASLANHLTHQDLASSKDFDGDNLEENLSKKLAFLGLYNYNIVKGDISKTMCISNNLPDRIFCALIDIDLYSGYQISLQSIWSRVVEGGQIFLDEYYSLKYPGPRSFVNEFIACQQDAQLMYLGSTGDFERWSIVKTKV